MRAYIFLILLSLTLIAKVDFSEMSTQELIAMVGYVESKNLKEFNSELKSRVKTMTPKERELYREALKRLKN